MAGSSLLFIFTTASLMLMISVSSAFQFHVGGPAGWIIPSENDTQTYIEWAARNRFHVGDTVYFKYKNDSVLVVNRADYINCNVSNPIAKFEDGNTLFRFDRYGFFYFISGKAGHCKSGQRLVIRVMVHPEFEPPSPAPSPSGTGGGGSGSGGGGSGSSDDQWGPPTPNSTVRLSVASYFMTALGGMVVILYLFM
ncbi:Plastocyanin-like [Macleaya cordata]|uniref:Plastocyanin-like n=1 Tax=Macleaya cordata TaxID=56857 RepID=A0A200RBN3_MACCD|nr:Plastocyanin-like [Macleaya cordata]